MKTNETKNISVNGKEVAELKIRNKVVFQRLNYILGKWVLGALPFKGFNNNS